MVPFTRHGHDAIYRAIHCLEIKEDVTMRNYRELQQFHKDLNEFINNNPYLSGIHEFATRGFTLLLSLQETLDCHAQEYREKLAAFKAAQTVVTAHPLAKEVLRIAISRGFRLLWLIMRLNSAFLCFNGEPRQQLMRLLHVIQVIQEKLVEIVDQWEHQTKSFDYVLWLASRKLDSVLFVEWKNYRKTINDIEYMQ